MCYETCKTASNAKLLTLRLRMRGDLT